ncbi:MAG TPA: sigma 54-interacting transcriptional regulator, partial [Thermoanaerobaculia bacterium]|nr:sigma 54-interacting transcriptional regulator [Thermoanaerobaculia bacterium]
EEERVALARTLVCLGRFAGALAALEGTVSVASGMVRARCQLLLGQLRAARATLRRLELTALAPGEVIEMADIAARVYANSGDAGAAAVWVRRALDCDPGSRVAIQARLVAAAAAWDRRDRSLMDAYLAEAEGALAEPGLAWRWHHLRGLRAELEADGSAMVEHLSRALRASRRLLARHEAAGLWNDLGLGRAQAGDLAGAERAFLHVLRLYGGCDGPRRATLALHNLAEIRLRRGRFAGVREILESSTAENRLSGNLRGLAQDLELWARFELALGRSQAALALCREAGREMESREVSWRREETAVLAARALGWLREVEPAATELAAVTQEAVAGQLEPEERPALWAHAGLVEAALEAAAPTPFSSFWQALLSGESVPVPAWQVLDRLEPYRAARLVFDAETLRPGVAPPHQVRSAAAFLRSVGAVPLAERLEARDGGPWEALATYLAGSGGPEAASALLAGAGCPEAELVWMTPGGERRVLCSGAGGEHELTAEAGEGSLVLRAPRMAPILRALFALLVRDLTGKVGAPATLRTEEPPVRPVPTGGIIGESPPLKAALERLARLAAGELPILILGESGTGKELAARHVHRLSPRAKGPFVPVNSAALSETLLLSDLFGHARGAFTGADRDRAGVFETAHGGTVFLDEIGDLPPVAQGMLLRVLQEGEVRRLGESLPRKVDARVLTATHRDLSKMVREGTFRQDLFYRLKVGSLEMPPLRDRGEDVLLLAEQILGRLRLPRPQPAMRLSREARARLLEYRWPGNVRELQNVLSVAATLADEGVIGPPHLELPDAGSHGSEGTDLAAAYHRELDAVRRRLIEEALEACGGNVAEAARRLGMSRQGLSYIVRTLRR